MKTFNQVDSREYKAHHQMHRKPLLQNNIQSLNTLNSERRNSRYYAKYNKCLDLLRGLFHDSVLKLEIDSLCKLRVIGLVPLPYIRRGF